MQPFSYTRFVLLLIVSRSYYFVDDELHCVCIQLHAIVTTRLQGVNLAAQLLIVLRVQRQLRRVNCHNVVIWSRTIPVDTKRL